MVYTNEGVKGLNIIYLIYNNKMNSIGIFIYAFILPIFSLTVNTPKLCINCRYIIKDKTDVTLSKCSLFPRQIDNPENLINGIKKEEVKNYYYCSTARTFDTLCGSDGSKHKRKYNKE